MAKKAKKPAPKKPIGKPRLVKGGKPVKTKQTRKQVDEALAGPIRRRVAASAATVKDRPLPGMENIGEIPEADEHMLIIAQASEKIAELEADRLQAKVEVQAILKKRNRTVYQRYGYTAIRVPGAETLKVSPDSRKKNVASASAPPEAPPDAVTQADIDDTRLDAMNQADDSQDDGGAEE